MRSLLVSAVLLASSLPAAEAPWTRVTTAHVELLTNDGEKKGRDAIPYFEQAHAFFLLSSPVKKLPEFPVRIVALRAEKGSDSATASLSRTRSGDCIVMRTLAPQRMPTAVREYTRLLMEQAGLRLPAWTSEGLAELFATLAPRGAQMSLGSPIPAHVATLKRGKWLDLDTLHATRDRSALFTAESWALVHMLRLSPAYRDVFPDFLLALHSGKTFSEALRNTYDKSAQQVYTDLEQYVKSEKLAALLFNLKAEQEAEAAPLKEYEAGLAMADVQARSGQVAEARAACERLAAANPGRPEIEEQLGYLAWQAGDNEAARQHLLRAVEAGSNNPLACLHAASLSRGPEARQALERALALKPQYDEARLQLGLALAAERRFADALAQLRLVKRIDEDNALTLYTAMASASLELGDEAGTRANAALAQQWARTPEEMARAGATLRTLDARKQFTQKMATRRAEGIAQRIDCSGGKIRLFVRTGTTKRKKPIVTSFLIADPASVTIRHAGSAAFDFACGPQKPFRIVVEYVPETNTVQALEF